MRPGYEHGSAEGGARLLGDGLALAGAASMAGYMLLVRAQGPSLDAVAFSGVAITVGAVCLLLWAAAMGVPWEIPSLQAGLWILMAALIPQLVGHTTLTWSLRFLPPTGVAIAAVSEPVVSTILGVVVLHEAVGWMTALGCTLTLVGVAVGARGGLGTTANPAAGGSADAA